MLLENMVMCRLVTGNKSQALREMSQVCSICQRHPRLLNSHRPQLHMLIGLYAMSMNCMDAAEMQFTTSLRVGVLKSRTYNTCLRPGLRGLTTAII